MRYATLLIFITIDSYTTTYFLFSIPVCFILAGPDIKPRTVGESQAKAK
jgi:hypothetical protein